MLLRASSTSTSSLRCSRQRVPFQIEAMERHTVYAAALGAETLTVYSGFVFPLRRAVRRRAVTGLFRLRTPLLRLAGVSVVIITAPGTRLILPAVPEEQAAVLTHVLAEEIR